MESFFTSTGNDDILMTHFWRTHLGISSDFSKKLLETL